MNDRIPISTGFHIRFSKDGRALSAGREETQVLPEVRFWLYAHQGHENYGRVQQWCTQKENQIKEDMQDQQVVVRRKQLNEAVDRAARESGLRDKRLIELVRAETFKAHGIPQHVE